MTMRITAVTAIAAMMLAGPGLGEISDNSVKIVVLNDQASVYSGGSGLGSVLAARMAIEDFGGNAAGKPVELLSADHQNKPDVGLATARKMIDVDKADAFFDISNSAISLGLQDLARKEGKIVVHVGSAHADLYGKSCSPTGALWLYDTYALARGLAKAVSAPGRDSWFLLTADYSFGKSMEEEIAQTVKAIGGTVKGSVRHPLGANDFAGPLLQAQSSGAAIIGLANAADDTINAVKQAKEFMIGGDGSQKLAGLLVYLTVVKAIGPDLAQGLNFLTGYYWDADDESREFGKRFAARNKGAMPTDVEAGVYSAVSHYLKSVNAAGSDDGLTVMRKMKATPVSDFFARGAKLREDGRLMKDLYLAEVKPPKDVHQDWDLLKIESKVPADSIIRPVGDSNCAYLDK